MPLVRSIDHGPANGFWFQRRGA